MHNNNNVDSQYSNKLIFRKLISLEELELYVVLGVIYSL